MLKLVIDSVGTRANNFWQHDEHSFEEVEKFVKFSILQYQVNLKFSVHQHLFTVLGTSVSRKFGHSSLSYEKY